MKITLTNPKRFIAFIIVTALAIWIGLSFLSVVTQNTGANPTYSSANFFVCVSNMLDFIKSYIPQ